MRDSNKRLEQEQEQEQEQDSRVARMQNHEVEVNSLRHECIECNEIARELKEKVAEDLELHAALLISQAHHNEVIFSASRLSNRVKPQPNKLNAVTYNR